MNRPSSFTPLLTVLLLLLIHPTTTGAENDQQGWRIIATKIVNQSLERGVIQIGAKKGKFNQIRIQVTNAPLEMKRFIIHFKGDNRQPVPMAQVFEAGATSRNIRIRGGKREIDRIVFWHNSTDSSAGIPTIAVWGRDR